MDHTNADWQAPARPSTLDELTVAWAKRDDLYARQSKPMTLTEVEAIREGRQREVMFLPVAERAKGFIRARTWFPPDNGVRGSLRDYLS